MTLIDIAWSMTVCTAGAVVGNSNMLGKKHSEEAKIKMREARKNRISKILEVVKNSLKPSHKSHNGGLTRQTPIV